VFGRVTITLGIGPHSTFIVTERKTCSADNHCKVEMEVGNCYYSPGAFPAVHYLTEYLKKLLCCLKFADDILHLIRLVG